MLFGQTAALSTKAGTNLRDVKDMRSPLASINTTISMDGTDYSIDVIKPVHPRDNLWIAYGGDTLTTRSTDVLSQSKGDCGMSR